jgi:hypothetical protein
MLYRCLVKNLRTTFLALSLATSKSLHTVSFMMLINPGKEVVDVGTQAPAVRS